MKRYNIFFPIHKGLQAMLFNTAISLQQTCFTDTTSATESIEKVEMVVAAFEKHAHTENAFVFSSIKEYEPGVMDAFEREHVEDHLLAKRLLVSISTFKNASTDFAKEAAGEALANAFVRFMIFNLNHMAAEEKIINPILWRYYTDAQLQQITARIIASIEPATMSIYTCWMLRAMSTSEIAGWITEVKEKAPEPMWQALHQLAEKELPQPRWQAVERLLNESVVLA